MRMNTDREHSEQQTKKSRWGFRGMTVRDWLPIGGALLVPLVIALGSWAITWQLEKLENQRAEAERELAEQRAQDEALQAYLDQMSHLILDRQLLEVEQGDPVHTLAQARTSTAILRLDAEHNESVTHFLITSGLSVRSKDSPRLLRRVMHNRSDQKVGQVAQRSSELVVEPLPANVGHHLGRQAGQKTLKRLGPVAL